MLRLGGMVGMVGKLGGVFLLHVGRGGRVEPLGDVEECVGGMEWLEGCVVVGGLAVEVASGKASGGVVVVEEVVEESTIRQDPNRTVIPGAVVDAVVEEPFSCHPSFTSTRAFARPASRARRATSWPRVPFSPLRRTSVRTP